MDLYILKWGFGQENHNTQYYVDKEKFENKLDIIITGFITLNTWPCNNIWVNVINLDTQEHGAYSIDWGPYNLEKI